MGKCLIVFEDGKFADFHPLTHLRPVWFLRSGIRYLFESIIDEFPDWKAHLFCRIKLTDIVSERVRHPVNEFSSDDCSELLLINGRIKYNAEFTKALKAAGDNVILKDEDTILAIKSVTPPTTEERNALKSGDLNGFVSIFEKRAKQAEIDLDLYKYLWDLVNDIDNAISVDFNYFKKVGDGDGFLESPEKMRRDGREFPGINMAGVENIYISRDAELMPNVVLNAENGPIFIGSRARIEPNTCINGPAYIGKETYLVGGKISGCSIGAVCRIGGEVEESIIQGYTNKYHEGFLGHAYLGEWVNLGALCTNSDLKNNYSPVSVSINGETINTGSLKVGSFIGDYTKTSIGTMLNTGINIGVSCNIVGGGLVAEKEISSFTWYNQGESVRYDLDKAIITAERSMARRDVKLSNSVKEQLTSIFKETTK
jgi:UDP-N-acetylglucosamine diphosphorylase/glucosamine-1-phosphate N-acetyltransferase